jgi:hypothetical protein
MTLLPEVLLCSTCVDGLANATIEPDTVIVLRRAFGPIGLARRIKP